MDFHGNNVHQVGYRNPYVLDKVKAQLDILPFSPRRYSNPAVIAWAEKLTSLLPASLDQVLFAPGGTSAVGIALKLARMVTGKYKVVSLIDSFHGASQDAIAAGGELQFKKYMGPVYSQSYQIAAPGHHPANAGPTSDLDMAMALETLLEQHDDIGAFIAETIRNTEVQVPSVAYWKKIREICTRHYVLLILDEIAIAFGRTGTMFAFEHFDIEPDILCLGKGMGAGIIPFAGIVTRKAYNIAPDVSLGHYTHEKSPLGSVAALAMTEFLEANDILRKVQDDAIFMRDELSKLQLKHPIIAEVRGIGLLWALELAHGTHAKQKATEASEKLMYACLEQGLSFKISHGNMVLLSPPLIIDREALSLAINILDQALSALQE